MSLDTQKNDIKDSWLVTTLDSILLSLETGKRPKGGVKGISEGVPSLGAEHLNSEGGFNLQSIKYVPKEFALNMTKGTIDIRDILVVKDGATTGKTSFVDANFPYSNAVINEHVFICRTSKYLEPKFIFYFLFSQIGKKRILENFKGSAQGGINTGFVKETLIPIAPLNEQKRIVSKIEELFSELDNAVENLKQVQQQLKIYRQAVLKAAFEGKLVNSSEKQDYDLESIILSCQNGLSKRRGDGGIETKVLRLADIDNGKISENNPRYINLTNEEISKYKLQSLDLVCIRVNGSPELVGRFILVTDLNKDWAYCDHLIRLQINQEIASPKYIELYAKTQYVRNHIKDNMVSSAGQNTISQGTLKSIRIQLPPLEEQNQIVQEIESRLSICDELEKTIENNLKLEKSLRQSILKKAFEGELVPQDPNDEPASILLEKIKLEKAELEAKTKVKRSKPKKEKVKL